MYPCFRQRLLILVSAILSAVTLQLAPAAYLPLLAQTQADPSTQQQPATDTTPCPVPTTYTLPSAQRRTIVLDDWQASFEVPNNYRALRADKTIQILSPESFVHFRCRRIYQLTDNDIPIGITLNLKEGAVTEADVRRQAAAARGSFLGETQISEGNAFVYTSYVLLYALHLSRPTPDEKNTVVITSILSNEGDIFYEEAFDIIRGTFTFQN